MSKKLTTEEFIVKAKEKHGDTYDYSMAEYNGSGSKIKIICKAHGTFSQTANSHLVGGGCIKCANIKKSKDSSFGTDKFIKKSIEKHGSKYDYSESEYKNSKKKVKILCRDHGEFFQRAYEHYNGQGCPKCANIKKSLDSVSNVDVFIKKAREVHGDKYDYSSVKYMGSRTKVKIICYEHGEFKQEPRIHISGHGCTSCGNSGRTPWNKVNNDEFIRIANEVHGNKYIYNKTNHKKQTEKIIITCIDHGDFEQISGNHLAGKGCFECGKEKARGKKTFTKEEFVKKAKDIHGDKYDYSFVEYVRSDKKVKIKCNADNETFYQEPSAHYLGLGGCPKCSHAVSIGESEISEWLETLNIKTVKNTRTVNPPKEIDIYLPDYNIGIEYNGEYWHSERTGRDKKYHKEKCESARKNGIHLMQFWDSEWENKKEIVKSIILNKLGICDKKYFARKLQLKTVETKNSRKFCEENHIHGFRGGIKYNGLYDNKELIALMITASDGEMVRFVTKINCCAVGGFSKLLKYSGVKYSFVDQRIFDGHGYLKNGFKYLYTTEPNYSYKKGSYPVLSRIKCQKHKLKNIIEKFDESLTEVQNMNNNGFFRIFDCGHLKMVRHG